jgi:hypothetical protein
VTLTRALSELGHRDRGCGRRPVCPKGEGRASEGRWQDLIVSAVHEGIAKANWTSKPSGGRGAPGDLEHRRACDDEQALRAPSTFTGL